MVYPYNRDKKQGSLTCRPTPAPQVNPAAPYVEYPGQRCLEAGRLAPFDDTRRQRQLEEAQPDERWFGSGGQGGQGLRQLATTINTPGECSTYV